MKTKKYFLFTKKNNLSNKNNIIHELMIKGGFIRKLCSGIFILLPNALKVINNIVNIIKNEMFKIGGLEIQMPVITPFSLWNKGGRFYNYDKELYKFYDRNNKMFLLSPTNEEIITEFFFRENLLLSGYPYIFYQFNNKFRDEIRIKSNLIRCKEFIMKDAYSFHTNLKCLDNTYLNILNTYLNIFKIIGLNVCYKKAKCGKIGGILSHEFHFISKYGENKLNIDKFNYLNILNLKFNNFNFKMFKKFKCLYFNINKIDKFIIKNLNNFIRTYIIKIYLINKKNIFIILLINNYKSIDLIKIKNLYPLSNKIKILNKKYIFKKFKILDIFLGPFGLNYRIIADCSLINYINFIIGSNINNYLFINVNWKKHLNIVTFLDISKNFSLYIKKFNKNINIIKKKSIEVAHIFKLLDKYSLNYKKNNNINKILMGCYGIGIYRIFFSVIEQYSYNNKIILPLSISSFKLGIIPINLYNNKNVYSISYKIYKFLIKKKIDVLIENRNIYFGEILNDFELIGIPNFLIISNNLLLLNILEFRDRINNLTQFIRVNEIFNFLFRKYKN